MKVNLATGARTALSDDSVGKGPLFDYPERVLLDSANSRYLVLDRDLVAVVAVDISTGDRSILSGPGTGTGTAFLNPYRMSMDVANRRLVVSSQNYLFAVDLETGNRTSIGGGYWGKVVVGSKGKLAYGLRGSSGTGDDVVHVIESKSLESVIFSRFTW